MRETKYHIVKSAAFKKTYRLAKKQGRDLKQLAFGINQLAQDIPLPANWKDHQLTSNLKQFRECHIGGSGDWLLMYEKRNADLVLHLVATGSHADLFG